MQGHAEGGRDGFFDRLKNEFFHHRDWMDVKPDEFMTRLDARMKYYCEGRIEESSGWLSPTECRMKLEYA